MNFFTAIVALVVGVAAGIGAGFLLSKSFGIKNIENAKAQARAILREAAMAAEQGKREKLTEAKEEIFKLRQEVEREGKE
ncbi:MAG TPA: Rnase Y domain-containing protein, partial [Synergistales bacterium]|nr:Rnase Y domain-containing protein [Synergistales bacterium]